MAGISHEVPLPPAPRPEREPERRPERERVSVAVSPASVWSGDVHRRARDFAHSHGGARVGVTVVLADSRSVELLDLHPGPGEGFVTLIPRAGPEREIAVRLDEVRRVELGRAEDESQAFRVRSGSVGFSS